MMLNNLGMDRGSKEERIHVQTKIKNKVFVKFINNNNNNNNN